ncbi:MAG: membrane protein insertase YidC [Pseudobdellovibrio sp.]
MNENKNETPFGNPRFLAVMAITFFALWGWQYYLGKKYPTPQTTEATAVNNSTTTSATAVATASVVNTPSVSSSLQAITQEEKIFAYEDETVKYEITSKGMGIKTYVLKNYTDRKKEQINFNYLEPQAEIIVDNKVVYFDIQQVADGEYTGTAQVEGKQITRTLKFDKNLKFFVSDLKFDQGLDSIQTKLFQIHHQPQSSSFLFPSFEHQDFIYIEAGSTKDHSIAGLEPNEGFMKTSTGASLASIGTQYFTAASINKSEIIPSLTNKVENNIASVAINYNLKDVKLTDIKQIIYLGPKKTEVLNQIDTQLVETLNYGMFGFISKILMKLMVFLHSFLGNWGLAIIALTLIVRTILLPFNVMSFKSAQAMQKIKPKMDAVREKYKNDPMKMNQETMALMKNNNANPLSGCLPMLLQIPIFFALWRAIGSSIELYQQPFFGWITDLSYYDPYFVFPILMGITMFLQQKMTPTTMDPMQAKILNFMPILFTLFMLTLPSGLTIYNFVSSLFGVIQQYFLLRENKTDSKQVVA